MSRNEKDGFALLLFGLLLVLAAIALPDLATVGTAVGVGFGVVGLIVVAGRRGS